jgi:hypothetical protein
MVSAHRSTGERAGYPVAASRGEQDPCDPGFEGSVGAGAEWRAGRVPLRGWSRWRRG